MTELDRPPYRPDMDRRHFLLTSLAATGVAARAAEAQTPGMPRIGIVLPGSLDAEYERRLDSFRQGLREFGYIDKQNVVLEYRWAQAEYDNVPDLVFELLALKIDVLVVDGQRAGQVAKSATRTVPIVLAVAGDPVGTGLVASLARPGGNITGMTLMAPELSGKRLALLREVMAKATRVAVVMNPDNASSRLYWREAQRAAPKLGMKLEVVEVRRAADLERAFARVAAWHVDGVFVIEEPILRSAQSDIAGLAVKQRLPTMTGLRSFADAGALLSFGPSFPDMFRRAAGFVVKILRGAKPADLPIEQPSKFELVVNLKTATALGLTIPPSLLLRADHVIE